MTEQKAITVKRQTMDIMSLGNALASSGYFADATQQAQAVVKVLAGQELGLGPIASMTNIHIIQGKPTLSANAMAAVIKNHPLYDYKVIENTAKKCVLEFFSNGESLGVSEFTMEDAKTAELSTGRNSHSWKKFPRNMLFARAMSNGARWYCPDAFSGVPPYTPDELDAVIDGESGDIIEGQPVGVVHTGNAYPSDDASIWLPSPAEFQAQCEQDFNTPFDDIKAILKDHCGFTGFTSAKATEMYNCLCQYFADKPVVESDEIDEYFPRDSQPALVDVPEQVEPVTYE